MSDAATGNTGCSTAARLTPAISARCNKSPDKKIGGLGLAWFVDIDSAMACIGAIVVVELLR